MASGEKKTTRLKAHLVFLDESGFLTAPLVRRTWAPCGKTPVFYQCGRHREKASTIAALVVSPKRREVGLCFSLSPNENVDGDWVRDFLRDLLRSTRNHTVIVWDRLNTHRSRPVRALARRSGRLHFAELPPYAPELNPVEQVWSWLKRNPLANDAPATGAQVADRVFRHGVRLQNRHDLLRSFIRHGPLPLRLR